MPSAIPKPERLSAQEAAAAIVALINASPRSPRLEEIEAIITKAVPAATSDAPASPLLTKIRQTAARLEDAFAVHARLTPGDPAEGATEDRIEQLESELEALEDEIPSPPQSFADLLAWAEIARSGADVRADGTLGEAHAPDVFARPAARLVGAVMQYRGAQAAPLAMSPAHAAHYQEWRSLIDQHVREFEKPSNAGEGGITEKSQAEEARAADSLAVIDGVAEKILAEPVQTWGDLLPCAEVAFWFQWPGIGPRGPHASDEMEAGPMSGGEVIDRAVTKLLKAIFTLTGIGHFAEARHG